MLFGWFLARERPFPDEARRAEEWRVAMVDVLFDAVGPSWVVGTGSWRHGTGLRGHSSVDVTVSLRGVMPASSEHALRSVRAAMRRVVPSAGVRVAGGAVVVVTPGELFAVVVRPAFHAADDGYWIPTPGVLGGWVKSRPDAYAEHLALVDERTGGGVRRLARLLKAWKRHQAVPVSSFYLEAKAVEYMTTRASFHAIYDLCGVLEELDQTRFGPVIDPTSLDVRVEAWHRARDVARAEMAVAEAARAARQALTRYRAGQHTQAACALQEILGEGFTQPLQGVL